MPIFQANALKTSRFPTQHLARERQIRQQLRCPLRCCSLPIRSLSSSPIQLSFLCLGSIFLSAHVRGCFAAFFFNDRSSPCLLLQFLLSQRFCSRIPCNTLAEWNESSLSIVSLRYYTMIFDRNASFEIEAQRRESGEGSGG